MEEEEGGGHVIIFLTGFTLFLHRQKPIGSRVLSTIPFLFH